MKLRGSQWSELLQDCGVKPGTAQTWSTVFADTLDENSFSAGDVELPVFLGQVLHESGMLSLLKENLYYSTPGRLMRVWPSRFKSLEDEQPFLNNPEALADKVYGGRMGNDSEGDGARYIGRGLMMVTGKDNYDKTGQLLDLDLLAQPELLEQPQVALRSALAWWEARVPDGVLQDPEKVTKVVNGGTIGLNHRVSLTILAKAALEGYAA